MKKLHVWAIATLSLLLLSLSLCTLSISAEDMLEEGSCGEGVTWSLNLHTGELIIEGSGDMQDYGSAVENIPWNSRRNSIQTVTVREGVTALSSSAFFNCRNLTKVSLPAGITEIPANAFASCSKLNELTLPDSVTTIGDAAFIRCTSLSQITFPAGLETVGSSAFTNCTSLTSLTLPVGVSFIGNRAFSSCGKLTSVSLPNTLTSLGDAIFAGTSPEKVLFYGTEEEWQAVSPGGNNTELTDALIIHPYHIYDRELTDYVYLKSGADCENPEIYYKSCACGEAGEETFTHGSPMGHTGGTATCLDRAICAICRNPTGSRAHTPPTGSRTV